MSWCVYIQFLASLLGVDAGQEAIIRALLYPVREKLVLPYDITVAEFTDRISEYRNKLGKAGLKDEGLVVPTFLGAEGKVEGNIIAGNENSTFYARTLQEALRIVYGTGNESVPGGFFPNGLNGRLPRSFLGPGN
ncbi:hypothetical protein L6164_036959 [Bauhinia variegata]|uniref:Uncharacterized protein n=1 Tax=Bauhinia variegata TaxID=167791 RepID=A0ACB9KIK8_BAUVA|nr:hypothetical protein L6164_036959 [Bauhinia variegata]